MGLDKWLLSAWGAVVVIGFVWTQFLKVPVSCATYDVWGHWIAPIASVVLIMATVFGSLFRIKNGGLPRSTRAILLGFWLVTPPLWFGLEYFKFYRPIFQSAPGSYADRHVCGVSFDEFKYGQESAAKIWAAIVAFLAAVYFKEAK